MGVIPVPPATRPTASCLPLGPWFYLLGRILVFFPFIFGDGAADGEELADVHVMKMCTHRSIRILLDHHVERSLEDVNLNWTGGKDLLIDVADGGIRSDGRFLVIGTFVFRQNAGIDH
jgi:hypothetical protein